MIDEAAKTRLRALFDELREYQFQFQGCETVDVHTRGCTGDTPLKIAAVRQDLVSVTDLLNAGADPNNQGEDGETPLHHAAARESIEIVRLLLAHGASPHIRSDLGQTPIDVARIFARISNNDAVLRAMDEVP